MAPKFSPYKCSLIAFALLCKLVDIIAITESWLHDEISDDLIAVEGFKIYRNDRSHSRGGGFCAYIPFNIHCQRRHDLACSSFECIWLWLRPKRLPRPLSGVAICLIYNPPASSVQDVRDLDEYIIGTSDKLRNIYSGCASVILGDFNNYDLQN